VASQAMSSQRGRAGATGHGAQDFTHVEFPACFTFEEAEGQEMSRENWRPLRLGGVGGGAGGGVDDPDVPDALLRICSLGTSPAGTKMNLDDAREVVEVVRHAAGEMAMASTFALRN